MPKKHRWRDNKVKGLAWRGGQKMASGAAGAVVHVFSAPPRAPKPPKAAAKPKRRRRENPQPASDFEAKARAFYKSKEWKYARYEALKEHGRRCGCCGATPEDGVRLNVDHIKSLRKFWDLRLVQSNLQVLCADCNIGKGARHEDDFRDPANDDGDDPLDGASYALWHGL